MDGCVRIERISNGYTVSATDPKIQAANRKPDSKWKDPCCEYSFKTVKEVMTFLEKNLDKALPKGEYDTSFDAAVAADDGDD